MRFSLATAGLLAATAAATSVPTIGVEAEAYAHVEAQSHTHVEAQSHKHVEAESHKHVEAQSHTHVEAQSHKHVEAESHKHVEAQSLAHVDANVIGLGYDAEVEVNVDVAEADIAKARSAAAGFQCPTGMSYCPWTKACSCPAGMKFDGTARKCVGSALTGAWPQPRVDVFASRGVALAAFCAASPYRIVAYDAGHAYCRAGLDNIAFVAAAEIAVELRSLGLGLGVDIDIHASISAEIRAVIAGLAGLYVETAVDAVALFNTDVFGLATVRGDVNLAGSGLSLGLVKQIQGLFCAAGVGKCNFDCVSYCTKGCKNYIDLGSDLGAHLEGLVGLCILPNVVLVVNAANTIVTLAVDGLLCLVGGLLRGLLGVFSCNCS